MPPLAPSENLHESLALSLNIPATQCAGSWKIIATESKKPWPNCPPTLLFWDPNYILYVKENNKIIFRKFTNIVFIRKKLGQEFLKT